MKSLYASAVLAFLLRRLGMADANAVTLKHVFRQKYRIN
jgi:hypothetical protein